MILIRRVLISISLVVGASIAIGQSMPKVEPSIERLNSYPLIHGRSPNAPAMSPDGSKIVFGWNQTGERKLDLYILDFPNGKPRKLVSASDIQDLPRQDDSRKKLEKEEAEIYDGGISTAKWSPNGDELLFSYKGRHWLIRPDGKDLRAIVEGSSRIVNPEFTEDGKYISYTDGVNVYKWERKTGRIKQLTYLSKPRTSVESYSFSPDGKWLGVVWTDESKMGSHQMMDFSQDRATVVPIPRMWNGDLPVDNQVGVVSAEGGLIKFVADLPRYMWLKGFKWSPDSKRLAVSWIKDDFFEYTISLIEPDSAKKSDIYKEKAPRYTINDWREIDWTRDSKRILFGTDIYQNDLTYRSLFSMDVEGKDIKPIYRELHDLGNWMRPKNSDRIIAVTAARSPLTTEIVTIESDGKQEVHVVMEDGYSSPKNFNWADLPLVSDDGKSIATMASNRKLNAELYAVTPKVKRLTISQLPEFQKVQWADVKRVAFPGPDGSTIHGLLYTKPGADLTKKRPAILSNIYADSGKAAWSGYMENYAVMNLDMVVLSVDFRSSWGYGGDFNAGYYRKMGIIDVEEAVAAKNFLASLPYVRSDRVGLWGWSYGGYLTCMSLLTQPGVFHTGVAVASVTDWKSYNEWYTRRRIGLVKDDAEWFDKSSPITFAGGLKDNLLLVHGMLDDNVLYQDTARLMQRMIDAGVYFDSLSYPRDDHSIGKVGSRPHVMASILRYLYFKLSN